MQDVETSASDSIQVGLVIVFNPIPSQCASHYLVSKIRGLQSLDIILSGGFNSLTEMVRN